MTIVYHGPQCGLSPGTDYRTICEHLAWCACTDKPLHATSHTCACKTTGYGPFTSLDDIQKDREREKEQVAT